MSVVLDFGQVKGLSGLVEIAGRFGVGFFLHVVQHYHFTFTFTFPLSFCLSVCLSVSS